MDIKFASVMKNKTLSHIFLIIIAALFFPLKSHAQFSVDAQLRNRLEFRDGYQKLAAEGAVPTVLISQRTRISFVYETANLKFRVTPQDVRLWGGDEVVSSSGVAENITMGLFEGYAEIKLKDIGWLSVGRQQLKYDNERILAARNWSQNGLSYDALVLKLKLSGMNLHIGSSWNTLDETTSDNVYPSSRIKSYNYLWLNRKISKDLSLSFLHVASGVTETDTTNTIHFRQTSGVYSEYKKGNLNAWGNVYCQYGKNKKGTNVCAFLFDAEVSYKTGKFVPGIGVGYLSGNKKTGLDQTTDHLFDVLYGARHKYFGFMDYFKSFSTDTKQGGLADYYFYLDCQLSKAASVCNTGHYFMLAQTNSTTPDEKNLGYENDIVLKYKFNDWGAIESGYDFFIPTSSLKAVQGVADNKFSQFFYLQVTLTPTLLKQ